MNKCLKIFFTSVLILVFSHIVMKGNGFGQCVIFYRHYIWTSNNVESHYHYEGRHGSWSEWVGGYKITLHPNMLMPFLERMGFKYNPGALISQSWFQICGSTYMAVFAHIPSGSHEMHCNQQGSRYVWQLTRTLPEVSTHLEAVRVAHDGYSYMTDINHNTVTRQI